MSILVTGGAGYIGSHTDLCLLNEGYDIVVVDNYDNSSPEALRRVMELTGKTFPYYEADACDEEKLAEIMKKHGVDSVIHFAGLKAVGESVRIPLRYYENNLLSTIRLLKAMETVGVKKMIFSSSATVYSADNQVPLTETGKLGCTNPYGWTKYMTEQILSGIAKYYRPEELVGKTVVAILNLPPRKMMGLESCGMLLSAVRMVNGKEELHLVMLNDSIPVGSVLC